MKKCKLVVSIIFFTVFLTFIFNSISAQESSTGIVVAPSYLSKNIGQGVEIEETFRVTNHRSEDGNFYVVSREIGIDENGEYYVPVNSDSDYRSSFEKDGWLEFVPNEFYLEKGEGVDLDVNINIPKGLPTNGYYLELVVTTQSQEELDSGVGITPEISIPISINYIGIGDELKNLSIVSFETDKMIYEYLPVRFYTHIINQGNVHVIPVGQIFISKNKDFADNAGSISFNDGKKRIFVDAGKNFEDDWSDAFVTRDESGKLDIQFDKLKKFRFGKYYAQLNIAWEENEGMEYIQSVTSFWVIPWKLLIIPFVVLILIIIWKKFKKWRKKGIKKYQSEEIERNDVF